MKFILNVLLAISILSCKTDAEVEPSLEKSSKSLVLSEDFKSYWYDGTAEVNSYDLEFYRYGEKRTGKAMLIFVTEDFLEDVQVKSNAKTENSQSVMKLNSTKTFTTGIYPYSIMQSAFFPLENNTHVTKITTSIQEWCGQVYTQLNNRSQFEITSHSYFEGEGDFKTQLKKTLTENDLWIRLRIDPKAIPTGNLLILPDFSYLRLQHKEFASQKAQLSQSEDEFIETLLNYKELNRSLKIYQEKKPPFSILKWEEIQVTGNDTLISKASKLKTLKTKYWRKNSNKHLHLRDSLSL